MISSRLASLPVVATLVRAAVAGSPNSTTCYSYGVDFVDEGSYFINSLSQDPFTAVSTFEGCQPSKAEVLLVDPNSDEVSTALENSNWMDANSSVILFTIGHYA